MVEPMTMEEFKLSGRVKTGAVRWLRALPKDTPTKAPEGMFKRQANVYGIARGAGIKCITRVIDGELWVATTD